MRARAERSDKGKPRKSKADQKAYSLLVRLTKDQRQGMLRAAESEGLKLSTWLRWVGMKEAAKH